VTAKTRTRLYLFRFLHVKQEVPCSEEDHRKALKQWRRIEEKAKYFDSFDSEEYAPAIHFIKNMTHMQELPEKFTPRQRMMVFLGRSGTVIELTEDTDLLTRFREFMIPRLNKDVFDDDDHQEYFDIVEQRDRFIANRINTTLGPNELGFLFLGRNHNPLRYLDPEISFRDYLGTIVNRD
jgi:hypothetical protein